MRRWAVVVIPRVAVGIAVVISLLGLGRLEAGGPDAKTRVREICSALTDHSDESEKNFQAIVSLGEPGRTALLGLASSKDVLSRCGLHHLFRLEDRRVVPIIRKILNDPHADVGMREDALYGVAAFKDMASFERAMEAFRSNDKNLISAAARALGSLGDERGLRALREALTDPRYERTQATLVAAVGVKGHEEAIAPLLGLANDPIFTRYDSLKAELILSLGRIGTARSRAAAIQLLEMVKDYGSRRQAALDLWGVLADHRKASQDPVELAEIDGLIGEVKAIWGTPEPK